ncbi:MAG: ruvC [Rickettsiaceae bacterium]|jgi:crossover junction endodeoxyribonuclease RuvC|nr:ruvC [Rickettsiaceae bacterium]
MIILGIDPGINCTGWAIIKIERSKASYIASGAIQTDAANPLGERLAKICQELNIIIDKYSPQLAAMEEVFINKNPQSSLKLSHARGALMATIALKNIPLREFAPNQVKKTVVGVGRAEKSQIQHMITMLVNGAKFCKADEADALAVAYTCSVMTNFALFTTGFKQLII